jgi:hypothetical protein
VVLTDGSLVIAGTYATPITTPDGTVTPVGARDGIVLGTTATGDPLWARSFGDVQDDRVARIAGSRIGQLVVVGFANHAPSCLGDNSVDDKDLYLGAL